MAEEFENYDARVAEARRAVDRWDAEGGAQAPEQQTGPAAGVPQQGCEQDILPRGPNPEQTDGDGAPRGSR